jgi:hypothetical protein
MLAERSKTLLRTMSDGSSAGFLTLMIGFVTLGHVPLGGQTHDRYNIDMSLAPHGDPYDDGGC